MGRRMGDNLLVFDNIERVRKVSFKLYYKYEQQSDVKNKHPTSIAIRRVFSIGMHT